ncbi:MAG: PTS sugar transporter subunit IIA [Desulfobacteraceae bacterium]|nr:PTS sugar transporter subunit IIA [Desulfobacteraceae bacterium]MCB9494891.1 PTS sugar transporter subunit IIA [Desulfobacteraceae bacterium]
MKLKNYLLPQFINMDLESRDKKAVLEELAKPLSAYSGVDSDELVRTLLERERLGSTGIGSGIAIPHGKVKGLEKLMIGFGLSKNGVSFESMDDKPAFIFFVIVTPEDSTGDHLRVLAKISRLLRDGSLREQIKNASAYEEILDIITENDTDD